MDSLEQVLTICTIMAEAKVAEIEDQLKRKEQELAANYAKLAELERDMEHIRRDVFLGKADLLQASAREKCEAEIKNLPSASEIAKPEIVTCEEQLYGFAENFDGHNLIAKLCDALHVPAEQRKNILKDAYFKIEEDLKLLHGNNHVEESEGQQEYKPLQC